MSQKENALTVSFRTLFSETSIIAASQGVSALIPLLALRPITERLRPADYGQFTLALTILAFAQVVLSTAICSFVRRHWSGAQVGKDAGGFLIALSRVLRDANWLILLGSSTVILYFVATSISTIAWWWLFIPLIACLQMRAAVFHSFLVADRNRAVAGGLQVFATSIRYGAMLLLLTVSTPSAGVCVAGWFLGALAAYCAEFVMHNRRYAKAYFHVATEGSVTGWVRRAKAYVRPIAGFQSINWAALFIGRYLLLFMWGSASLGLFGVTFTLGYTPMYLLALATSELVGPIAFALIRPGEENNKDNTQTATRFIWSGVAAIILFSAVGAGITFLYGSQICHILLSEEYQAVANFLPYMIITGGFAAVSEVVTVGLLARDANSKIMRIKAACMLVGIAAIALATINYGSVGLLAALLVLQSIQATFLTCWLAIGRSSQAGKGMAELE